MPRLPKPCVDTGMGLERIAAVLQHVHSNYEIDLFADLIKAAARETNTKDLSNNSLKVIADHIRACSFLIVDGVIPSNDGRGYVLRRIIRRALRHGNKLGQTKPFFHALVKDLVLLMGKAYPELTANAKRVEETLLEEELKFAETLSNGMKILDAALAREGNMLDGETVFTLYDTYGFPFDLTADVARERGKFIDQPGYEAAMQTAKKKSQDANKGKFAMAAGVVYDGAKTTFKGYEALNTDGAKVVALYLDGTSVQQLSTGESGIVVLDTTPFYAESGGQVGDKGELVGQSATFGVSDTQKIQPDVYGHHGSVKAGLLKVGDTVEAKVDGGRRSAIARNHSVTHLMHKALREVLGDHVQQRGSLVDDEKTRFDFVQNKPLTAAEIRQVEEKVNAEILLNTPTRARVLPIEEAKQTGAMMLFGEKYGDEVRVLDIGSSRELCGGTHVMRTGDIGPFKIYAEGGVAAGIRRVEATTGTTALHMMLDQTQELGEIARSLKVGTADVEAAIGRLQEEKRAMEKELARLKAKLASSQGDDLANSAVDIKGIKVLAANLEGVDAQSLPEVLDKLKDKLKSAAIVLSAVDGGKVALIAGVTKDATARVKAGDLLNFVAQQVGGKGGGKPEMARGSGTDAAKLPEALKGVQAWVAERA
jgi:alanyl-tRNA synthetase